MGIFEFEFKVLITPYFASIHCTQYMDNMRQSREPSFVITPPCLVNIVNRYFNTGGNKIRKILVGEFVCTGELVLDGFMATVWMVVRYNSCQFVVVCWPLFQFYFFLIVPDHWMRPKPTDQDVEVEGLRLYWKKITMPASIWGIITVTKHWKDNPIHQNSYKNVCTKTTHH